jgi:hypothetical protein
MTPQTATIRVRLPLTLKASLKEISARKGTSMNQLLVTAATEKLTALQTEPCFSERQVRANRAAVRRLLARLGGESQRPDELPDSMEGANP